MIRSLVFILLAAVCVPIKCMEQREKLTVKPEEHTLKAFNMHCTELAGCWALTNKEQGKQLFQGTHTGVSLRNLILFQGYIRKAAINNLTSNYQVFLNPEGKENQQHVIQEILSWADYSPQFGQLIGKMKITDELPDEAPITIYPHHGREATQKLINYLWVIFANKSSSLLQYHPASSKIERTDSWDGSSIISVAQCDQCERMNESNQDYFDASRVYLKQNCDVTYEGRSPYRLINPEVHMRAIADGYSKNQAEKYNFFKKLAWSSVISGCCIGTAMYLLRSEGYSDFFKNILRGVQAGAVLYWLGSNGMQLKKYIDTRAPYVLWFSQLYDSLKEKTGNAGWAAIEFNGKVTIKGIRYEDQELQAACNDGRYTINDTKFGKLDPHTTYYYDHCSDILIKEGGDIVQPMPITE